MKKAFLLVGLSFEAFLLIGAGVWVGQILEKRQNLGSWVTLLIVTFVLIVWFYQVIRLFRNF